MVNRVESLHRLQRDKDEPLRQLNVLISEDRHRLLKQYAVLSSQSMADVVSRLIDENIKDSR
ncbi:hypothetical protein EJ419_05575 [Alloscardovia theropitheci]|uniref:Uncharacterized protein n=1 Tax=Alloscardovia theropitheci TaxID=2496842 RepID=A0A4R0QXF9_9BIFI|nr:hypothetical protein [Alloscardovia theropitheci]TCD54121.1 hypothetical protein EJ419_05575 [Alloscardovia theropitheci]